MNALHRFFFSRKKKDILLCGVDAPDPDESGCLAAYFFQMKRSSCEGSYWVEHHRQLFGRYEKCVSVCIA